MPRSLMRDGTTRRDSQEPERGSNQSIVQAALHCSMF